MHCKHTDCYNLFLIYFNNNNHNDDDDDDDNNKNNNNNNNNKGQSNLAITANWGFLPSNLPFP